MSNAGGVMVPLDVVLAVVGPIMTVMAGAIVWLAIRYDKLSGRSISKKDAAVILREALREQEPELERLSYSDTSDIFDTAYEKDKELVRRRSMRPPAREDDRAVPLPPRQQRRVERYIRGEDPSTPPGAFVVPEGRRKRRGDDE